MWIVNNRLLQGVAVQLQLIDSCHESLNFCRVRSVAIVSLGGHTITYEPVLEAWLSYSWPNFVSGELPSKRAAAVLFCELSHKSLIAQCATSCC